MKAKMTASAQRWDEHSNKSEKYRRQAAVACCAKSVSKRRKNSSMGVSGNEHCLSVKDAGRQRV